MKKITLDHVERLSRGQRSGGNFGSRSVGHYLRSFERGHYQRALRKGYLEVTDKDRANLWHVWHKACLAQSWSFLVLVKEKDTACVYKDDALIGSFETKKAKIKIQELAQFNSM